MLYYAEGRTYEEIGELMGKSTAWVYARARAIAARRSHESS
jgi:hypothetical protein